MPMRCRKRLRSRQKLAWIVVPLLAILLLAIGVKDLIKADDAAVPPSPTNGTAPQPVGEEVDIFRERSREIARQERRAAKKKQKTTVPKMSNIFSFSPSPTTDVTDGLGMLSRGSHLIGQTFGRSESITPLEVMPYMLSDEHFVFSDVRGFITNSSQAGGNAGLGYRYLREDWNAWGGASIWYDADNSTSKLFQQVGLSFEGLIQRFELRSNVYLPFTSTQTISNTMGNAQIVGNQLLFGRNIEMGAAMRGVDVEAGYSLPIRDRHVLRGFVGGYFFESNMTSNVSGFKARVEGVINNTFTAQALYTNDNLYGTNLMVGLSMQFPFGNRHPTSGWKGHTPSPFRFVERNYNVIVAQWHSNLGNQVAKDPATGLAYKVEQVYEPPPPPVGSLSPIAIQVGDGTTDRPFSNIASAQAAGGNVIIVQSGSVLNEAVTLTAGQHLLAQGNYTNYVPLAGGGFVKVPLAAQAGQPGNATQTPIFTGVNGNAVTVASNTEVAGFKFSGTSGDGIHGTNAANVSLHDLTFLATGGDSIHLTNSSGDVTLRNIQIVGSGGNGIVLDGGNANISYFGFGTSVTAQGDGFTLSNLTGGNVTIENLTLKNTTGAGLRMNNVATNVTLDSLSVSQSGGPAVAIAGNTGTIQTVNGVQTNVYNTYNFNGFTTITSPNGAGFTMNGSDAVINVPSLTVTSTSGAPAVSLINNPSSTITIGGLTLNTNNGTGLFAVGLETLKISSGTITSMNAPAVDIQNSTVNVSLNRVSANGGLFGIGLTQSAGVFNILGSGINGSGGVIQNTTTGLRINGFGQANLNWVDFVTNGTAIQSNKATELNLQNVRITGTTNWAIDSMDDSTLTVRNSLLTSNGSIGGGTVRIQADTLGTFRSLLSNTQINDANGTPIYFNTMPTGAGASLASTIQNDTITGTHGGSPVIDYAWNGPASIAVANNTIYAYGAGSTAVLIQDTSTTDSLTAQVNGNTVTFEPGASQGVGLSVVAASTSQLAVAQNTFDFKGTGGIGTRFSLAGTTTAYLASNVITDEAGGLTGMLFDTVAANSRLQIDGNTINLLASDLTTHQGIIFTSVTPTIQFSGSINNRIFNATSFQSLFSIPVNASTGGFYINGGLE